MLECTKTYISKNIYEILYHNDKMNYKHWSVGEKYFKDQIIHIRN